MLQRAGVGAANADRWWAVMQMPVRTIEGRPTGHWVPCRMTLADASMVLRLWGYGSEVAPGSPQEPLGATNGPETATGEGDAA